MPCTYILENIDMISEEIFAHSPKKVLVWLCINNI